MGDIILPITFTHEELLEVEEALRSAQVERSNENDRAFQNYDDPAERHYLQARLDSVRQARNKARKVLRSINRQMANG